MFLVINCNRGGCLEPQSISTTLSVRLSSLFFFCLVLSRHKHSGRSKGWGTIAFSTRDEVHDAIFRFGGVKLCGRPMTVMLDGDLMVTQPLRVRPRNPYVAA